MAPHTFESFNASELDRNIDKLKETKHTCTFKLNLLRDTASASPTHLPSFDELENKLFNIAHKIYELEASEKERKKVRSKGVGYNEDTDGDEISGGLKRSVGLIGRLDDLLENIAMLKFKVEIGGKSATKAGEASAGNVSFLLNGHITELMLQKNNRPQVPKSAEESAAKKQKLNAGNVRTEGKNDEDDADDDIKTEQNVPKKAKEINWAPDGYHYVKSVGFLKFSYFKERSANGFPNL
jgi:hypothetical protein